MDDYFALLGIPQSLILDDAILKDAWHSAAALSQGDNGEKVNHAYAVLRDPGKRIGHFLTLHGQKSVRSENPGATLFDVFFSISATLQRADAILSSIGEASTALQRAGLMKDLLASLDELTSAHGLLFGETTKRQDQLNALSKAIPGLSEEQWALLAALGSDFTFLNKWESELLKRETLLQETLMGRIA